jgi:hypothetical protein
MINTTNAPYVKEDGVYNTGAKYPIWVTAAPELANWAKGERRFMKWVQKMKKEKVDGRTQAVIGIATQSELYLQLFIEFWVKPGDLFRPCPDSESDRLMNVLLTSQQR